MDQDINFQTNGAFATSAKTTFFPIPYRCTVRDITAIVQADPGDGQTITITAGETAGTATTAIGVYTFGTDIAAGATGEWTPDATDGDTVIEKGSVLKLVTSAGSTANFNLNIELDPYAR